MWCDDQGRNGQPSPDHHGYLALKVVLQIEAPSPGAALRRQPNRLAEPDNVAVEHLVGGELCTSLASSSAVPSRLGKRTLAVQMNTPRSPANSGSFLRIASSARRIAMTPPFAMTCNPRFGKPYQP
jgi:hypothetical protein